MRLSRTDRITNRDGESGPLAALIRGREPPQCQPRTRRRDRGGEAVAGGSALMARAPHNYCTAGRDQTKALVTAAISPRPARHGSASITNNSALTRISINNAVSYHS